MVSKEDFTGLRLRLSVKAKNGSDFILAASIVWLVIGFVWMRDISAYNKSIWTFIAGALLMPLAFTFSKILKTSWKDEGNPLEPLGLWLNFAQLFYFPFLVFVMLKSPEHFVMAYAIITGAHFFPYAWYYNTTVYSVFAGIISVGALALGLKLAPGSAHIIPFSVCGLLVVQGGLLLADARKKTSKVSGA